MVTEWSRAQTKKAIMRTLIVTLPLLIAACTTPKAVGAGGAQSVAPSAALSASESPQAATHQPALPVASTTTGATPGPTSGDALAETAQSNSFALKLFSATRSQPGNQLQSALSLRTALGMLALGAKGATFSELAQTLGLPSSPELMAALGAREMRELQSARSGSAQLLIANKVYAEQTYLLLPGFLAAAAQGFGAKAENVDFKHNADGSRNTINAWISNNTATKIPELIPAGGVNGKTRVVLTNAVYFKAGWAVAFDRKVTTNAPFFDGTRKLAPLPTMALNGDLSAATLPNMKLAELAYAGTSLVMDILLPNDPAGLSKLETELTTESLAANLAQLKRQKMTLTLPKFSFGWGGDVVAALQTCGIKRAFSAADAEFQGVSEAKGEGPLYVGGAFHKTFISVDEEGTEAAAASALVITEAAPSAVNTMVFLADHPFLFVLRDSLTGRIYFLGRVTTPVAK
jgi:serpin B